MAFCKYCGREIAENSEFCGNCGKKVASKPDVKSFTSSSDEPLKRSEYFKYDASSKAKQTCHTNWILWGGASILRVAVLIVYIPVMFGLSHGIGILFNSITGLIFGKMGLSIALMAYACYSKNRIAAAISALLCLLSIISSMNIVFMAANAVMFIAYLIITLNTFKLEKEYRTDLNSLKK